MNPGDIIYVENVSYTDHPKYHLVLSPSKALFFVINSNITNAVAFNNAFKNCQVVLLKHPNHSFMPNNESYIACHQIAPIFTQK